MLHGFWSIVSIFLLWSNSTSTPSRKKEKKRTKNNKWFRICWQSLILKESISIYLTPGKWKKISEKSFLLLKNVCLHVCSWPGFHSQLELSFNLFLVKELSCSCSHLHLHQVWHTLPLKNLEKSKNPSYFFHLKVVKFNNS